MEKVIVLEFYEDTTLKDIYEELMHYHNQRILAETTYKGITLSNEDMDKLKEIVTRLELGLTEEEYQEYKKHEEKQHEQFKLYYARTNTPYIVRYWIERATNVIEKSKQEEWQLNCYTLIKLAYENDAITKKLLNVYYQEIISASKIFLAISRYDYNFKEEELQKVIDEEFSNVTDEFEMRDKYLFIDSAVSRFAKSPYHTKIYRELSLCDKVMDNNKFSDLPENSITKKRIPDYLKNKF